MKRALEKIRRERNDRTVTSQPEPAGSAVTKPIGLVKYWGGAHPPVQFVGEPVMVHG